MSVLPSSVPSPTGRVLGMRATVLGAVIVAFQVIDVLTTLKVVGAGGSELNPFMSVIMELLGPVWWLPKVVLASCIAGYFATRQSVSWRAVMVLILCAAVAVNNIVQIVG
jgi:hypothetical protein